MTFDPSAYEDRDDIFEEAIAATEDDDLDFSSLFAQVDKRLDMAQYYRHLLDGQLFEDSNDSARAVEKRIRSFVREELKVLLGIEQPRQEAVQQFTDEEVEVLRMVIGKVTKTPSIVAAPAAVKTVAPVKPKPQLRQIGSTKKPTIPGIAPKAPAAPMPPPTSDIKKDKTTGRLKKKTVNEDGKEVVMDVTPQVISTNRVPMPTGHALSTATQTLSASAIAAVGGSMTTEFVKQD